MADLEIQRTEEHGLTGLSGIQLADGLEPFQVFLINVHLHGVLSAVSQYWKPSTIAPSS